MKLSAPKQGTYAIAVILLIVAVVARFVSIPTVFTNSFWIAIVGGVLLALGCYCKNL